MPTYDVLLDDKEIAAFEAYCRRQACTQVAMVAKMIRDRLELERMKESLDDPELAELYRQLTTKEEMERERKEIEELYNVGGLSGNDTRGSMDGQA